MGHTSAIIPTLKYTVKAHLDALSASDRKAIKNSIKERFNISESTYCRYVNLRTTDLKDIPATVLRGFSELLHVDLNDLFTA